MTTIQRQFGRGYGALLQRGQPAAYANVRGSEEYAGVHGTVLFFPVRGGTLVSAEVYGLPAGDGVCGNPVFGFHIHENGECSGNETDPFADTGGHYNPQNCPHPFHAGDLPPLFGNNGYAFCAVVTDRFHVQEVIGRSVVIHSHPDDFRTQPSGDSGSKIACGVIRRYGR